MRYLALFLLILSTSSGYCQFHFSRYDSVAVSEENGLLDYPWAGGLNHPQFSNMDFNLDGRNDLLVFDKSGNKIISFTTNASNELEIAPKFRDMFVNEHNEYNVRLHDWVLLRDFDNDGDADIYTYSNGGMAVYRNDGNSDTLIFTLMTSKLLSDYGNGIINIYVSPTDLPAIMDVDNDGDMDIVTFSLFGTSAEYHQNMSVETYGIPDSLNYVMSNPCWGDFEEDPSTVAVSLDVTCKGGNGGIENSAALSGAHSGFTMLGIDIEGDGDKDLVVSIVSFDTMNLLVNDGSSSTAHMGSQDLTFPQNNTNTVPINLYTFPAAFIADINNDGKVDLLASPYQENNGHNYQSSYLYENIGTATVPDFDFVQNNFLQDNMIELGTSAYPTFFDFDNDGLKDMLVGNLGYFVTTGDYSSQLAYYRNTGTASEPAFTLQDRDLLNISALNLDNVAPTFGDLDGDGDDDLIIGDADGLLHYFDNSAGPGNSCNFTLTQPGFQGIDIIGQFAAPFLHDVDGDTILDLVIGERNGNLNYYRNDGTANAPNFVLDDPNFGGVDMRSPGLSFGYSAPFLFEYEDELNMLVGSESGTINLYDHISEIINGPEELFGEVGDGTSFSTSSETTPFGFSTSSARNQYLILGDELTDAGFTQGVIEKIGLLTENGPSVPHAQFYIKMRLTELTELNAFVDGMTTIFFTSAGTVVQGNVEYQAQTPIIWDGQSNLVVEFCWFQTAGAGTDLNVEFTTTPFTSNAYASSGNFSGCGINFQGSSNERPNFSFTIKPSFNLVGEFPIYEGERATPFAADLNDDDMLDFVMGNLAGGLAYYKGDANGLVINGVEPVSGIERSDLHLYPNPNNGSFIIEPFVPMAGTVELRVFDSLGQVVWSGEKSNLIQSTIDLSELNNGMYFIDIRSDNKVALKRFVIQN